MGKLMEAWVDIQAHTGGVDKAFQRVGDKLKSFVSMPTLLGGAGGLAGLLGISAGVGMFSNAIKGASDLSETMNKVGVIFGKSGSVITDQATEMSKAYGLPKKELLDAGAIFGQLAIGAGKATDQAAKFASQMVKVGADAKSFQNTSLSMALEKIRAGLSGEAEPLRAFGVFLTEDKMKAEAAALGFKAVGGILDDNAKLMARASLITKGLALSNNDLANTADGTANQMEKFWGSMENLSTGIGSSILPAFTEVLRSINDMSAAALGAEGSMTSLQDVLSTVSSGFAMAWRNAGTGAEIFQSYLTELAVNGATHLTNLRDIFGAFGEYLSGQWLSIVTDVFRGFMVGIENLVSNIKSAFVELEAAIRSGFTKPIDIKMKPIFDGFTPSTSAFKMPDLLKTVDFSGQRAGMLAGAIGSEITKAGKAALAPAVTGKAADPNQSAIAKKHEDKKAEITDAEGLAKKLIEASLGSGDVPREQLNTMQEQLKKLDEVARLLTEQNRSSRALFGA